MTASPRPTFFLLPVAGWKEHVRFPKLKIGPIAAKLDTGARTSALHADEIHIIGRRVTFVIIEDGRKHRYKAPLAGRKTVRSSNGLTETRAVIRATIEIGRLLFKTDITLTDRSDMGVPMLLGRGTLKSRFIVNPAKTFLLDRKAAS
jgi:hypothetical protein